MKNAIIIILAVLLAVSMFSISYSYRDDADYIGDFNIRLMGLPRLPTQTDQWIYPLAQIGTAIIWDDDRDLGFWFIPYALIGIDFVILNLDWMILTIGGYVQFTQDSFMFGFNTRANF